MTHGTRASHKDLIKGAVQYAQQAKALEEAFNEPELTETQYRDVTISAQISMALRLAAIAALLEMEIGPYPVLSTGVPSGDNEAERIAEQEAFRRAVRG